MKKRNWILWLFEDNDKIDLLKIMEFKTIREIAFVLDLEPQLISNWYHGLINPRGILNNCVLYQTESFC
tara:strand:+ start:606 stop:812 length:207 start_codon:yes stop_codon:yes gene_type:complete